jgi:Fic family protein
MLKHAKKAEGFKKLSNYEEAQFFSDLHDDLENNEVLKQESFYGVYHFLVREEIKDNQEGDRARKPIIFIIKNIKTFP